MTDGPVVVVGAGVGGLVCARELRAAGRDVVVLEREAEPGGRVRSTVVDGFTIDRGFQVLFTAYPVLRGYLDLPALALREFLPAARIPTDDGASLIGDAIKAPSLLLDTITARGVGVADKLRLLALRFTATALSVDDCFAARYANVSARDLLRARGLSEDVIGRFFAPFYGGIFLDPSLGTSAAMLLFTFKMLTEGATAVPARGMGAIPAQMAAPLGGAVRYGAAVEAIELRGGRAVGVRLESGEVVHASDVVLAVEPPVAARLAGAAGARPALPEGSLGCATAWFSASEPLLPGRALWLNPSPRAVASHAVTITEVAPEYAPAGRHLVAATALGDAARLGDAELVRRATEDVVAMRGGPAPAMELVSLVRVPYAQYAQPPGFRDRRPSIAAGVPGLWLAGEALHSSSLEGAARGGRDAARALLAMQPA